MLQHAQRAWCARRLSFQPSKRPRPPARSRQVDLSFTNLVHQFNTTYNMTAVAVNDFGASQPSAAFQYTTPVTSNAPILDFVEVLPPTDLEPFGSLAVTINTTADGGSGACWACLRPCRCRLSCHSTLEPWACPGSWLDSAAALPPSDTSCCVPCCSHPGVHRDRHGQGRERRRDQQLYLHRHGRRTARRPGGWAAVNSWGPACAALAGSRLPLTRACLRPRFPPLPLLQRVFLIGQAAWMRGLLYNIVVTATNGVCTPSDLSNSKNFTTPL